MGARYHTVAIGLHWLIAAAIAANLILGSWMDDDALPKAVQFDLYQWHKSLGITVLLLSVARLLWRLGHQPPPPPDTMKSWEIWAARLTHVTLYALMIALPLTGWWIVSLSTLNIPTMLYGIVPWPHLPVEFVADRKEAAHTISELHEWLANLLLILIAAHIAAALKHHFINRDGVMWRMLPRFSSHRRE